jgi:glycosyltransferase involved in cell wall biosynthesis
MEARKDWVRRYVTENYSWHKIVDRYEELYTGMLSRSGFEV